KAKTQEEKLNEAVDYLIGTWTYTGQGLKSVNSQTGYTRYTWVKFVIKEDGTAVYYYAQPSDSDWGKPAITKYEPFTDKFIDTGERYYGVKVYWNDKSDSSVSLFVQDDGFVRYSSRVLGHEAILN